MNRCRRDRDARRDVAGDDGWNDAGDGGRKDASRQVLQHLALEAVVIGWMSGTTRNGRRIDVPMRLRSVRVTVTGRMRVRRLREPRQRAERWPGQRNERDPGDNPFHSPHIEA